MAYINLGQVIYPIGTIYQSTNSTSPASIYGGGWTSLTDGRFLRPQGSWNNLGGEDKHTLTVAEMPSHQHMSTDAGRTGNFGAERDIQLLLLIAMAAMQHILLGQAVAPHTTTFPHIEHAIAGIELPNILGGVLC